MSSRVAGASLALIAAALLAVSIATPAVLPGQLALFAGQPTVDGHRRTLQDAYVGLHGAEVCNTGGDGTCRSSEPKSTFKIAAIATLGVTALLGITAVILAILTLRKSEGRNAAGRFVRLLSLIALAGVGVMILLGPTNAGTVPIGFGMGLYGGAVVLALLASVIALRPPPPIRLRVADRGSHAVPSLRSLPRSGPVQRPQPPGQPAFGDDRLRSTDFEARKGREPRPVPPSESDFAGSSEPFAPPLADRAGMVPVSQLRPLYEASPQQGGTGGLLPIERPAIPSRPPTPISRATLNEGLPAPPPSPLPPPPPPATERAERARPTLPQPSSGARAKPASIPPPPGPHAPAIAPAMTAPFAGDPSIAVPPIAVPPVVAPPSAPPIAAPPAAAPPIAAPPAPSVAAPPVAVPPAAVSPVTAPPVTAPAFTVPSVPAPPMVMVAPGPAPRTQVSLVPPMPDNDPPIAPPTAQVLGRAASTPSADPNQFPRAETPLAPPPPPATSARSRRDSRARARRESQASPVRESQGSPPAPREGQVPPRALRDTHSPRAPMRAAVPMPDRTGRSISDPARAPQPSPPARSPSPRPTISTPVVPPPSSVPAIPPIPTIPAIPELPRLPENEVTATEERIHDDGDFDLPTVARVPIEITENTSKTTVSPSLPMPEDLDTPADDAGARHDPRGSVLGDASRASSPRVASRDGEAVTVPARSAEGRLPAVPTTLAGAAPPVMPLVRDRSVAKLPITTAPTSLPPPRDSKQMSTGPCPACPQCESPMAWVEEHLRFYCKSCRMYF